MVSAWAFKNVRHELGRSGAGAMPAASKIFATVVRATVCPTLASAPTMRESLSVSCPAHE